MKTLRVLSAVLLLSLVASTATAAEYEMTIIAGKGANLDIAFAATGCIQICQGTTLACHCYTDMYTQMTYSFTHGTSTQNAEVEFNEHTDCAGQKFVVSRVWYDDHWSSHDHWCFTCVDGKAHKYNPACPEETAYEGAGETDDEALVKSTE